MDHVAPTSQTYRLQHLASSAEQIMCLSVVAVSVIGRFMLCFFFPKQYSLGFSPGEKEPSADVCGLWMVIMRVRFQDPSVGQESCSEPSRLSTPGGTRSRRRLKVDVSVFGSTGRGR